MSEENKVDETKQAVDETKAADDGKGNEKVVALTEDKYQELTTSLAETAAALTAAQAKLTTQAADITSLKSANDEAVRAYKKLAVSSNPLFTGEVISGATVTGNAATAAESALVGERLDVRHDIAVTSAAAAGYAASAILAKARLDSRRAKITIPPHCGLELWDVVSIVDIPANQGISYRVRGYEFGYDVKIGTYIHRLELCNV